MKHFGKIQRPDKKSLKNIRQPGNVKPGESLIDPEGYPVYPPGEDIYKKYRHEPEINPEEPTKPKDFSKADEVIDAETEVESGIELDVPGAELDDEQEDIGNEDEENNYYSLGGDNHENLEEDQEEFKQD